MAESISQEDVESAIKNLGIELRKAIDDALDRKLDDALLDQRERACFRLLVEERAKEAGEKLDEDRRKLRGQIAWWGSVAVVMLSLWEIAGCPRMVELVRAQVSEHFASEQVKRILSSYTNEKLSGLIDTEMSIRFPIVESNVSSFVEERVSEIARREAEVEKGWERANQQMDVVMKSASARSGSRKAYDELISIARSTNELSKTAQIAISEIQERYKREKYGLSFGQGLKTNDGGVVTSDAMEEIIRADNAELGAGAISMLGRSKDTSGVATLVWSVQNSAYLEFVYLSIRSIENLVKTNFPPLGVEDALSWWKDNLNKEEYHSYYSRYLDCSWGTNGIPSEEVVWKKIDLLYETIRGKSEMYHAVAQLLPIVTFAKGGGDKLARRKEIIEYALEYWGKRKPIDVRWYVFKAIYYDQYDAGKLIEFVNSRLKSHPQFEDELKRFPFKKRFFELQEINWPSRMTKKVNGGIEIRHEQNR